MLFSTPVGKLFEHRTASLLAAAGFTDFGSVMKASDSSILLIRGFNSVTLRQIRNRIQELIEIENAGVGSDSKVQFVSSADLAKGPGVPFTQATPQPKTERKANPMAGIKEALEVILDQSDEALAEVDRDIADYEAKIVKLKRIRKMLCQGEPAESRSKCSKRGTLVMTPERIAIAEACVEIIREHGSMTANTLIGHLAKRKIKMHHVVLWKLVKGFDGLVQSDMNLIDLAS